MKKHEFSPSVCDYWSCRWGNRQWNIPCASEKFQKLTLRSQRYMPALSLFLLFFKAKTLRNQLDYSKVSTQLYECLYPESARSARYELLMLFHNVTQSSVLFCCLWVALFLQVVRWPQFSFAVFHSFYLLTVCPQRRQRETGCLFTVTYIKVGKQAFQSQCVRHRRGPIGVQKETEATEEGGPMVLEEGRRGVLSGLAWNQSRKD